MAKKQKKEKVVEVKKTKAHVGYKMPKEIKYMITNQYTSNEQRSLWKAAFIDATLKDETNNQKFVMNYDVKEGTK